MDINITHIKFEDWEAIAKIYGLGLETGLATFETEVPTWKKWNNTHLEHSRLAAWSENEIIGWAALSAVSNREVYRGVAEVSVYVRPDYTRCGVGTLLLKKLVNESEQEGIWTLQAGIFSNNKLSINLHKKLGFREIGYREKVAKRDGQWQDNVIMERRSKVVGLH